MRRRAGWLGAGERHHALHHARWTGHYGFMAAGMLYWMIPRLYGRELHSRSAANAHFWTGTFGILLYVVAMWISGIMQGLMLSQVTPDGLALKNTFLDTLQAIRPLMGLRVIGGAMFLVGWLVMCINLFKTIASGKATNEVREVAVIQHDSSQKMGLGETFFNDPLTYSIGGLLLICGWLFLPKGADVASLVCACVFAFMAVKRFKSAHQNWSFWYEKLLHNYLPFTILTFVAVVIGAAVVSAARGVGGGAHEPGRKWMSWADTEVAAPMST